MAGPRLPLFEVAGACLTVTHAYVTNDSERICQVIRRSEPATWWRRDSALLAAQGFWAGDPCAGGRVGEVLVLWERSALIEEVVPFVETGRDRCGAGRGGDGGHRRHGRSGGA